MKEVTYSKRGNMVTLKNKALNDFIKAMGKKKAVVKVGVLGQKSHRSGNDNSPNNATIGAKHEFGEDGLPVRSFLRMPLTFQMKRELNTTKAIDKKTLKQVIKDKSFRSWIEKIGIVAVVCVQKAFDSGGFGQWKKSNMAKKKVHQTLVETSQLRRSISYEVNE